MNKFNDMLSGTLVGVRFKPSILNKILVKLGNPPLKAAKLPLN
jgi:hypothetical protein